MVLCTCGQKKHGGALPGPLAHPCGRAAKALDDAGQHYELRTVGGYRLMPWTWPARVNSSTTFKILIAAPEEVLV